MPRGKTRPRVDDVSVSIVYLVLFNVFKDDSVNRRVRGAGCGGRGVVPHNVSV